MVHINELLNEWNDCTSPYTPRTDEEHKVCRARARVLNASLQLRRDEWRELESGYRMAR
jgi:hypothetical protein